MCPNEDIIYSFKLVISERTRASGQQKHCCTDKKQRNEIRWCLVRMTKFSKLHMKMDYYPTPTVVSDRSVGTWQSTGSHKRCLDINNLLVFTPPTTMHDSQPRWSPTWKKYFRRTKAPSVITIVGEGIDQRFTVAVTFLRDECIFTAHGGEKNEKTTSRCRIHRSLSHLLLTSGYKVVSTPRYWNIPERT